MANPYWLYQVSPRALGFLFGLPRSAGAIQMIKGKLVQD